jgi:hypothetical protein
VTLNPETITYLDQRAAAYNGAAAQMLAITPNNLNTDTEVLGFWQERDLSHILPQSLYPEHANDWSNIIPEDPSLNRSRGDSPMSADELDHALSDNESFAALLDSGMGWLHDFLY